MQRDLWTARLAAKKRKRIKPINRLGKIERK